MGFPVYDYRTDILNFLVTPHIRARIMRMEPGHVAGRHSHDLGHEIFLVLEGQAEFTIDGETEVLGPGQACVALVDQTHQIRVVGDDPMTMYLSVTPHILPTHTGRTEAGDPLPHRFSGPDAYDIEPDLSVPVETLLDRHVGATETLSETVREAVQVQKDGADALRAALARGDEDAAADARRCMWEALDAVFKQVYALADVWNDLAPRATETE